MSWTKFFRLRTSLRVKVSMNDTHEYSQTNLLMHFDCLQLACFSHTHSLCLSPQPRSFQYVCFASFVDKNNHRFPFHINIKRIISTGAQQGEMVNKGSSRNAQRWKRGRCRSQKSDGTFSRIRNTPIGKIETPCQAAPSTPFATVHAFLCLAAQTSSVYA